MVGSNSVVPESVSNDVVRDWSRGKEWEGQMRVVS